LPLEFLFVLGAYFMLTLAYSLALKGMALVDVIALGLLYTLRIVAGSAALLLPLTPWMLAFSLFTFFSLALAKRFTELQVYFAHRGSGVIPGRGYQTSDLVLLQGLGPSSGLLSVLVLAIYIQFEGPSGLYSRPSFIWMAVPAWLYWISRLWMLTHRHQMHDDPVVFALKDRVTYFVGMIIVVAFFLAI
jgi:4-hydroxybenzoate polyprenyltransferase